MRTAKTVTVVIPALNEAEAIGRVIAAVPAFVDSIIVVDNGSTDDTASVARCAGAMVVSQSERGYGAACLAGIAHLPSCDIVVFLDGDFSDDPSEMQHLVDPIIAGEADLVIGSRTRGACEPGALTGTQKFGNWLACRLLYQIWGAQWTDLGPFRAIRHDALLDLQMRDRAYGWTVEMQIKAAARRLNTMEVPVSYRPRIGISKISGTVTGSVRAGATILRLIARSALVPGR